ncbi:hypothetical protein N0V86_002011 [Didymella sp. IMI 355093]|nr:hypothetical protein N0V86_002011 [Didymella sp. IMI 355093]
MKTTTILSLALAASTTTATASNAHAVADLIARAIDPATMDPIKFSVLSVLKTAMPTPTGTATDIVLPTGDVAPQWYKDLPADVMVLLAQMYPATSAAAVSETALSATTVSSSSIQDSTASATASAIASQTTLAKTLEVASVTPSASVLGTGYSNGSAVVSTGLLSPNATGITGGTTGTGAATGKPGLELPGTSAGAKNAVGTGSLSAIMGFCLAAAFCLFA